MVDSSKILIAYYTWSGNTQEIANQIQEIVGGDLFSIEPVEKYPSNYQECLKVSKVQIDDGFKPPLTEEVDDIGQYDIIFVGSPNWYSTIAPPVATFLNMYDFNGKTVVPFITHAGGGVSDCITDITMMIPDTTVFEGFVISGSRASSAEAKIRTWLRELRLFADD
ncbi:MAG: flavodoxin [Candidatus Thorarchaeota archaeon]